MNPIDIPIFYKNNDSDIADTLEKLGIESPRPPMDEFDIRDITFYNINCVSQYFEANKEYGCIHSNDDEFISPMTKQQINELIKENQ